MKYTETYLSDLESIARCIPNCHELDHSKILITGAGGLIGSALADFLSRCAAGSEVFAAARSEEKLKRRFLDTKVTFVPYDALKPISFDMDVDYIIHAASPANPRLYVEQPVETMLANMLGVNSLLEYARTHMAKRLLYLSSSEVYGKKETALPYRENDYGFLDIKNPRACYPSSKRAAETLLEAYRAEYGVDSVAVRPGHVYGPTATRGDTRASSQFFYDVLDGKEIVMKSAGTQMRSYCYVLDCVSAILTVLLNGESGKSYNISNRSSVCTIRELAECIADAAGSRVVFEKPSDRELAGYNLMDNSSLDAASLTSLGWEGIFDLKTGVAHTLDAIGEDPEQDSAS